MLNLTTKDWKDPLFLYSQDANLAISFCVWVLQWDGLHISPFDRHPDGNKRLRAEGLNPETWQFWLAGVVATQNQHLAGNMDLQEQQRWMEETFDSLEAMASQCNRKIDKLALREHLKQAAAWQRQQYEEALEQLGPHSRESTPPDVWLGEPRIRETLEELWSDYLGQSQEYDEYEEYDEQIDPETVAADITQQWYGSTNENWLRYFARVIREFRQNKLYQDLQKQCPNLKTLHIYKVDYPAPLEYPVPPEAIIISNANGETGSKTYCNSVMRAAKRLSKRKNSRSRGDDN